MKKGSKAAKAWGAKMKRLRGTKKGQKRKTARRAYTDLKKRKTRRSTRKGGIRKTARRAYTGLKRRVSRRKNSDSAWNF